MKAPRVTEISRYFAGIAWNSAALYRCSAIDKNIDNATIANICSQRDHTL